MATLTIEGNALRISLGPFEKILALQGSFRIPISKVKGATDDSNYISSGLGIRAPGTGFPGLIAKGRFHKQGQRVLVLWRRGQQTVVVELSDSKWDRIVLGCDDAKLVAKSINRAVND